MREDIQHEAALKYAQRGWPVVPLCWPTPDGRCGCSGRHKGNRTGKAPLYKKVTLEHGVLDASTGPRVIAAWWSEWPNANIGIDLQRAHLMIVAPDSPQWLAEFKKRDWMPP